MKILVINSGSSSVKFQVFAMDSGGETCLAKGIVEKIGTNMAGLKLKCDAVGEYTETGEILSHKVAISRILDLLSEPEYKILKDVSDIKVVGHRVVHGGEFFTGSAQISGAVMDALEKCIELAPLHNPPNIRGIEACRNLLPGVPQVGVFDTAFHQTMPRHAYLYGLPYCLYERYKIRRYGFHGTSHQYAAREAAAFVQRPLESLKIITCHLGNGSSIAAVDGGKSVDTSMGFTPLEGLMMGTRCGDLDPAIIPYLIEKDGLTLDGVNNMMNKHSGLYGVAQMGTYDMRDLEISEEEGVEGAILARTMFSYRVKKYIGAYAAVLGGLDILVFTGGIGENDPGVREKATSNMEYLGISLDKKANAIRGRSLISSGRVKVIVIKADEELVIAREAKRIITESSAS